MVSAPILAYPNFREPFLLFVYASSTGIGFTLAQIQHGKEVVIAYNGRGLNRAEQNYSTTEREALALVEGIKKFQPYLHHQKFTVVTDHSSLPWLMNFKDAFGRLARWALLLQQYDFNTVHRPSKIHGNADCLSRHPYDSCEISSLKKEEPQMPHTQEMQRRDPELAVIIDFLENDILPTNDKDARKILLTSDSFYIGQDGLLYHIDFNRRRNARESFSQLVVSAALRFEILSNVHDHIAGANFGLNQTFSKLRQRYWWKGMFLRCRTLGQVFNSLGEAFLVPSVEATVIVRLLIDEIISRHGAPRVLLSDRGTNCLSKVVPEVCKIFQIQKVNTSSYHPQTDGLVERFNSTLCQSLSMYVSKNQKDWDEFIPLILFAHRTSVLDAIGDSPFYVLYGREPRLPIDIKYLPPAADDLNTVLDYRKRVVEKVELAQKLARENLQRAQQKMNGYYDQKTKEPVFEVGQRV